MTKQSMQKSRNTQWHPAFYSAMQLEFAKEKDMLDFYREYSLNTKPIQMDLLIIKKKANTVVHNEIGKIFKGHNIFEYKCPEDTLNIDTFFKTLGYANLYKAGAPTVDGIKARDMTISFVRSCRPQKLMEQLSSMGLTIRESVPGIYAVAGHPFYTIQILVTDEMNAREHIWLTSLRKDLDARNAGCLLSTIDGLTEKDEQEYADSVLQVAMAENKTVFKQVKEVPDMCQALRELMEPEIREELAKAREVAISEGLKQGIKQGTALLAATVQRLRSGESEAALLQSGVDREVILLARSIQ